MSPKFLILTTVFLIAACGVKGKPLPPLQPVPMGDGKHLKGQEKSSPSPKRVKWKPEREEESGEAAEAR